MSQYKTVASVSHGRPRPWNTRQGAHAMSDNAELLWVLGHQIRPLDTDDTYGLIEVTSLPKVPGPPPHFHEHEREFFMIQRGTLDVMENGLWQSMGPGSFVELAPGAVHTFIN